MIIFLDPNPAPRFFNPVCVPSTRYDKCSIDGTPYEHCLAVEFQGYTPIEVTFSDPELRDALHSILSLDPRRELLHAFVDAHDCKAREL